MSCQKKCDGCSCSDAPPKPVEIEDCLAELNALRRRNQELETRLGVTSSGGKSNVVRKPGKTLRSSAWFDCRSDPGMTAIYMERYFNYGITREELMSGKPMIGIAQTGSDIAPCNRHHQELAKRVREGIRTAGGIAFEFPVHPIQETSRRPTATLDRNLAYLGLVEILTGYFLDGVVLLTGCDKTTPACLMAAATVNIPAICLNVGPMLNGYSKGALTGAGSVLWKGREMYATGEIDEYEFMDYISRGTPSVGHCNTMGTASTMNALAESLGMALPGSAAIPAAYRHRAQCAYETGKQIVEMVEEDRKPSDLMTREAFENAIVANAAFGGSTNAPIHINAIAQHMGVQVSMDDWDKLGSHIPLLLNMQPSGEYLGEEYFRAGGLPAIMAELLDQDKINGDAMTCNGKTMAENVRGKHSWDRRVIRPYNDPLMKDAGFIHLKGTLFNSAIMKTCVISPAFRERYLSNPEDPEAFEGSVVVFDGPEDYNSRLENMPNIDENTILIMRGVGPLGYPGAAEVVNMHPPGRLLKQGIDALFCIGDGRQSGTSGCPSILNASPEAAAGGNLAIIKDGDKLRIDLRKRRVDILIDDSELQQRIEEASKTDYPLVPSGTPWQEIFRQETSQLSDGMVLKKAVKYQRLAQRDGPPRHNH
ncbi:Dihydroxy-acid/6-phosphogluconate dehydratase [Penicillium atrosanguineum]|uniref:Dihydroxy-acid/6-phosphogluconate dehydratase n=1 Tax=Penicillium atrosanguineum TaxID=1132637 RepID=A0A9W9KUW3_9EURO|nr:Nascent polypeptide-associated complex NAC [Penicillium atrosanguineum]KAJ5123054.1 Dihydroxy-acid/6-phosphogluconate dehydratase [Penicillium atrosanguineum]KAJ5298278.1 Nascent polypeptide-associated complex NAC [Penicillium atrosanguineum]KAJ5321456.1 Dihydroxy-acid/6-phosphogluconate dehydratase [Penicillium atrosanguineum]